ncbi:hypothetical protein BP6252_06775 [Coleophoma cylindrospora]|uniref:Uncharacterized protein n=1 Tax=Coleophoma cylindrospora TaxID=1849047 RepID=A0A3D8RG03_9HELO|nr:hypothetical protein BP6252_06775 [Coleophoma cylindrospora]
MSSSPAELEREAGRVLGEVSGPDEEIAHLEDEVARLEDAENPSKYLDALVKLGTVYLDDGQLENAERVLRQVKAQMVEVWGWYHTVTMSCLKGLVMVSVANGNLDEAIALYTEGINGVRRAAGSESPWTSELQNNAACVCITKDDFETAEKLLRKSLKAKQIVFGKDHRSTFKSRCNLALVHYLREDASDLESVLKSVLQSSRRIYGDGDETTVAIARQLIGLHFATENAQAGHSLCRDLQIQPHVEDNLTTVHYDNHIPSAHVTRPIDEDPPPDFYEILSKIGPRYSHKIMSTLKWTREKITKWAGISVNEFADLVGVPISLDWNNLTDADVLLNNAAILGHETTVQMLLEARGPLEENAQKDEENIVMQNAMRNACAYGNVGVARLFLSREVSVNSADSTGKTALHKAAGKGHSDVVVVLLEFNADIYARDQNGNTGLDTAIAGNFEDVIRVFMEHQGALVVSSVSKLESAPQVTDFEDTLDEDIWTGMEATVIDFFIDNSVETDIVEEHRIRQLPVETLIWDKSDPYERRRRRFNFDFDIQERSSSAYWSGTRSSRRSSSSHSRLRATQDPTPESTPEVESHHGNATLSCAESSLGDFMVGDNSQYSVTTSGNSTLGPAALSDEADADFKWIHLPANNASSPVDHMSWVEALMTKVLKHRGVQYQSQNLMKEDLWSDRLHQTLGLAAHSCFMKPYCRSVAEGTGESNSLVLFHARDNMAAKIRKVEEDNEGEDTEMVKKLAKEYFLEFLLRKKGDRLVATWEDIINERAEKDGDARLLEDFLFHDPPLHIRRTLDQFHYYMTDDTTARDSDQVITRYYQRQFPTKPPPIVMVDQLWLWIVDNKCYVSETIVTSFPQRWGGRSSTDEADNLVNMTNVIDSMITHLKKKARDPIMSVNSLSEMIIARCLGLDFNSIKWQHERYRYLEIFEHSIKLLADEETRCFNHFADRAIMGKKDEKKSIPKSLNRSSEEISSESPKDASNDDDAKTKKSGSPRSLGSKDEDIFDISREIELLKEVKDIRDELNILSTLFGQQSTVIKSFYSAIQPQAPQSRTALMDAVNRHIAEVDVLDKDAGTSYTALENLLDLKQKQANVSEARITRISGNTITVFTIVTIIFLPASFMAAFLALPITQYPKVNDNYELSYAIKYTTTTTIAVAVPFIIFALYVNPILRSLKLLLRALERLYQELTRLAHHIFTFLKILARFLSIVIKSPPLKLFTVCFKCVVVFLKFLWALFIRRQWVLEEIRKYKRAKTETLSKKMEWRKRRYVIHRWVAWRRREKEKNEEEPETLGDSGGRLEEVDDSQIETP